LINTLFYFCCYYVCMFINSLFCRILGSYPRHSLLTNFHNFANVASAGFNLCYPLSSFCSLFQLLFLLAICLLLLVSSLYIFRVKFFVQYHILMILWPHLVHDFTPTSALQVIKNSYKSLVSLVVIFNMMRECQI
jgi:hypothetical protein